MQTPRQKIVFRRLDGILLLDKPQGMSSNASLQLARRLLRAQKGGHTGSLDPLATGLLPLCFGEATKIAGLLLGAAKAYEAGIRLGVATDTDDAHGQVLRERAVPMFDDAALRAALAPFIGRIRQRAPVYSALKRGGEPLYARARRGEAIDAPEREVEVQGIDLLGREGADLRLRVTCGSGTYIRSIARDLGEVLGCGAHITALRRLWVEPFMQPAMQRLDELEAMDEAGRAACLLPLDAGLAGFPQVRLDAELESRFRQGQRLRLPADASADGLVAVAGPDGVVGLGQVSAGLLAPQRLFNLPGVDASRCTSH